jgi:hypothetical protein
MLTNNSYASTVTSSPAARADRHALRSLEMKVDSSTYGMADNSSLVKPPSCVGVVFGAEHNVYADTGFNAMRDQTFAKEPYVYNATGSAPIDLEQTVIVFPSADQAQAVVASAQNQWRSCAGDVVDQHVGPESGFEWKLGDVQRPADLLTVSMASNSYQGAAACQPAMTTTVVVKPPFQVCLSGTVYGPGEVVEAPTRWRRGSNEKHQRAATPVLPPGHRPVGAFRRVLSRGCCRAQQQAPKTLRLRQSCPSPQPATLTTTTSHCCKRTLSPSRKSRYGISFRGDYMM